MLYDHPGARPVADVLRPGLPVSKAGSRSYFPLRDFKSFTFTRQCADWRNSSGAGAGVVQLGVCQVAQAEDVELAPKRFCREPD